MSKETVEEVAGKSATESHPICMVTVDDTTFDTNHHGMIAHFHGFIAGTEWQKEQSAIDAIEFAEWVIQNFWSFSEKDKSWYNRTEVAPGKEYKNKTSQQLYELWQKSKSNADN